jgi:hypothetical protein
MDLQQRARPFAICPLVGSGRGPMQGLIRHCRPLPLPYQNAWFQGQCPRAVPLAEFQESLLVGSGAESPGACLITPMRIARD